ncbi:hypothetical protein RUM43_000848 [Polyplax serrata]|uniref:Uncharacterized protein n=1 Tax=Polyplax serrata TaxID=468196 RepID=A0AAN8SGX6_POLSC
MLKASSVFSIYSVPCSAWWTPKKTFQSSLTMLRSCCKSSDDMAQFFQKTKMIRKAAMEYDMESFDETLRECCAEPKAFHLSYKEKKIFMKTNVNILIQNNMLKSNIDLEEHLVSHFEAFPYVPFQNTLENQNRETTITLKKLRGSVEKQYLAWKFNVHKDIINAIYSCFSACILPGRSFSRLHEKFKALNECQYLQEESVQNKFYILTMTPFDNSYFREFKSTFAGVSWDKVGRLYPEIIVKPFVSLMELLDILSNEKFTNEQIQNALPVFRNTIRLIVIRLLYVLNTDKFSHMREHRDFLSLLAFPIQYLKTCNWDQLQDQKTSFLKERIWHSGKFLLYHLHFELKKLLNIDPEDFIYLCRHPKITAVPWSQIYETILYLKDNFSDSEIKDSIHIILYPKAAIQLALNTINENEDILRDIGIENGCVSQNTNLFNHGTKLRNKMLQLCLYYIEKPLEFSGTGIFL